MAGIGLELKKIYSKNNLSNMAVGAVYSSMVTIGPTLLIVLILVVLYSALGYNYIDIAQRELITSTILYIFIFSGILTSPFNAVLSRYIADKIYQRSYEEILPSYYTGATVVSTIGTLISIPIAYRLIYIANIDFLYVLSAYVLWMSVILVLFSTIYIHATKDYKVVFLFYIIGLSIGVLFGILVFNYVGTVKAIIFALTLGFFIISCLQFAQVQRAFKSNDKNYFECLLYFFKFKRLFFSNLLYTLGIYVHIFVFWNTPAQIIIAETFVSNPTYDMATCIAMFSNISASVIFIVMAETKFHEEYQHYMESVIGATYRLIEKNKNIMFNVLSNQVIKIFTSQSMITAMAFLFVVTLLPRLFFSSVIIELYPVLSIGYLLMFLMYSLMIYLYYFNDQTGSLVMSIIFFVGTLGATLISKEFQITFYGLGLVIGSFSSFTYGFFRIRSIEKNINEHIFCDEIVMKPVKKVLSVRKQHVVYKRSNKIRKNHKRTLEKLEQENQNAINSEKVTVN